MKPNPSAAGPADDLGEQSFEIASAERLDAQRQRDQAQRLHQKSNAVWEEAVRCGEAALRALDAGTAPVASTITQRIRAIEERAEASETACCQLQDRAMSAKDKSNAEIQRAAETVSAANAQVRQELADAADALAAAETALGTAMEELQGARAIWAELGEPGPQHPTAATEAQVFAGGVVDSSVESGLPTTVQEDLAEVGAMSATETLRQEIARARESAKISGTLSPAEEVQQELEALKGLRRELTALSPIVTNKETMVAIRPAVEHPLADVVAESIIPPGESDEPEPLAAGPSAGTPDPAAIYTGRVYLMFDAYLTQEGLEAVWDAIEETSAVGAIVDTRLVSRDEGVQMTLDLRGSQLDISAVQARLPGAQIAPLSEDRLRITWS